MDTGAHDAGRDGGPDAGDGSDGGDVDAGDGSDGGDVDAGPFDAGPLGWTALAPATAPSPRSAPGLAWDSTRNRAVLFGGWGPTSGGTSCPCAHHSDTWEFDGSTWTEIATPTSPLGRQEPGLVFDSVRGVLVMFSGFRFTPTGGLDDTWEYDGTDWTQITPPTSPPARRGVGMAYDASRGRVVAFGGRNGSHWNDTWEYDGATWTEASPATSPSIRAHVGMTYDPIGERVVLFGGRTGSSTSSSNETWAYDGSTWRLLTPSASPPRRYAATLAPLPALGGIVLFGGLDPGVLGYYDDTWLLVGDEWSLLSLTPSPAARIVNGLSTEGAGVLLFGGTGDGAIYLGDTWRMQ